VFPGNAKFCWLRIQIEATEFRCKKITPFLWFDDQAEDAVNFYTSLFKNSKIGRILRYTEEAAEKSGRPVGSVLTIEFEIEARSSLLLTVGRFSHSMNPSPLS